MGAVLWTGSLSKAFSWESFTPFVERGGTVLVVAPVFREEALMRAVWENVRAKRGQVILVTSFEAVRDPASYFLSLLALGAKAYLVPSWPLKPEGSFVVVDGKKGVMGPLVAGLADPEGKTREFREDEVAKWYSYGFALARSGVPFEYDAQGAALAHILRKLGFGR
jgi:hypothetical protein